MSGFDPHLQQAAQASQHLDAHLRFDTLGKTYEGAHGPVQALRDIDLAIARGEAFIREALIPAIGGYRTELGSQLEARLMNVRVLSANFCWSHRALGAFNDAKEVRP